MPIDESDDDAWFHFAGRLTQGLHDLDDGDTFVATCRAFGGDHYVQGLRDSASLTLECSASPLNPDLQDAPPSDAASKILSGLGWEQVIEPDYPNLRMDLPRPPGRQLDIDEAARTVVTTLRDGLGVEDPATVDVTWSLSRDQVKKPGVFSRLFGRGKE